jgi:hypothetical protein
VKGTKNSKFRFFIMIVYSIICMCNCSFCIICIVVTLNFGIICVSGEYNHVDLMVGMTKVFWSCDTTSPNSFYSDTLTASCVSPREFYRRPGYLVDVDLAPPPPPPRSCQEPRPATHRPRKRISLLTGGGGEGAKSYDCKKAWSSINHSILSILTFIQGAEDG